MQIRTPHLSIAATATALSIILACAAPGAAAADAPPPWEISIQSTVEWPPMAAPITGESEAAADDADADAGADDDTKQAAAPVMITERTLQASLSGQLLSIAGGSVQFAPALGGGAPVTIPLRRILSLRRTTTTPREVENPKQATETAAEKSTPARVDTGERLVTLRAGSSVPGRLLRVTEQGLVLAFADSGELTVPLAEILSITPLQSNGKRFGELPPADGRHVARLTTGEVVTGNIAPIAGDRDRLTISSPILSGEFPLALIESLLFPVDSESPALPAAATPRKAEPVIVVSFAGGAALTSPKIALENGILELEIWDGAPFRIPLASAESISFLDRGGLRPNGPILLWGQHADKADEFGKLRVALEGSVRGRELIIMDDDDEGADFSAALRRSSAFIWGEWENFDAGVFDAAISGENGQPLDEQLQSYTRAGGIAIFLGMSGGMVEHFGRLGLGEFKPDGSIGDGTALELTGVGETLAPFMEGEIKATNSTMKYAAPEGGDWSPLLSQPGNPSNAAIIGRRIGSGWVFLMGMDFYETDPNITRLIVELTRFRR